MNAQILTIPETREHTTPAEGEWSLLYKAGAAGALLTMVFIPIQILVFFLYPLPDTVTGWFSLFQNNRLAGLLDLDLLLVADQVLGMLVFLALYVALRRLNQSLMAIGLVFGFTSFILFIASNPAFAMLTLSDRYAAAATDAQKSLVLAAGEGAMSIWQGTSFQVSYVIGSVAAILISLVMLRSGAFSKTTAYLGVVANVIALGLYVPKIGVYISIFSVLFLWVWYALIARGFLRLAK